MSIVEGNIIKVFHTNPGNHSFWVMMYDTDEALGFREFKYTICGQEKISASIENFIENFMYSVESGQGKTHVMNETMYKTAFQSSNSKCPVS